MHDNMEEYPMEHDYGMDKSDMKMLADKAMSGEMKAEDIDPTRINFDQDMFPELGDESSGDKIMVVLIGEVWKVADGAVEAEFDKAAVVHGKKPPLGSGERFKRLEDELAAKGAKSPAALAAWIGRKKYGSTRFAKLSAQGRKG